MTRDELRGAGAALREPTHRPHAGRLGHGQHLLGPVHHVCGEVGFGVALRGVGAQAVVRGLAVLVGHEHDRREPVMFGGVRIHRGGDVAGVDEATGATGLPGQQLHHWQGRRTVGQRGGRQVDHRLAGREVGFGVRNVDGEHLALAGHGRQAALPRLAMPVADTHRGLVYLD